MSKKKREKSHKEYKGLCFIIFSCLLWNVLKGGNKKRVRIKNVNDSTEHKTKKRHKIKKKEHHVSQKELCPTNQSFSHTPCLLLKKIHINIHNLMK